MKFSVTLTFLAIILINHSKSTQVRNSERITISLGNLDDDTDDLEMIPESEDHAKINKKMEEFHDYVKNSKVVKHPWEKLFIKDTEYMKSEQSYRKFIADTIKNAKQFKRERSPKPVMNLHDILKLFHHLNIDKRQLSIERQANKGGGGGGGGGDDEDDDNGDDDDDDDDDDDVDDTEKLSTPNDLKKEYEKQLIADEEKKKAFKYSDKGKPEESINDAIQKIIDVKTPENCSNITGVGIQYVKCLIKNYKSHEMTGKQAFTKFMKMFLIWIDVYLSIAIPLWCIRGWGCCCIRWKYCRPKVLVREVKEYIARNPPGVYMNEEGEEEHYAPTLREKELYDKINSKLLSM